MNAPDPAVSLFESLASSAWHWLGDARQLRLGFSEDTISDLTSLEIARRSSNEAAVRRVSKYKERFVGFDWLWIIRRSGGGHALYVVQAKKMRIDQSQTYRYGRVKYPSNPPYQIEALEAFARHIDAVPLYCFYNNVEGLALKPYWHCQREQRPCPPQLGCTLVPIKVAHSVHIGRISNNFRSIHCRPEAVPWRCLLHRECTTFGHFRVSERKPEPEGQTEEQTRGAAVAEFLTSSIAEDSNPIDFDDFVSQFELEEIIEEYKEGAWRSLMERAVLVRSND